MTSESAAMCEGSDACVKKTTGKWGRLVRGVLFGMCVGKHRKGSDSEKLSLLLSLASEKEENGRHIRSKTKLNAPLPCNSIPISLFYHNINPLCHKIGTVRMVTQFRLLLLIGSAAGVIG